MANHKAKVTKLIQPKYWVIVPDDATWQDTDVDLYRSEAEALEAARVACSTHPVQPYHVMGCYPLFKVETAQKIDVVITKEDCPPNGK